MKIDGQLMEQWEPKVQKIVSNTYVVGLDREDIAQELRIALIKAARGFEEDRGILFHTYLHTAMINTVRSLIAKAQRQLLLRVSIEPMKQKLEKVFLKRLKYS